MIIIICTPVALSRYLQESTSKSALLNSDYLNYIFPVQWGPNMILYSTTVLPISVRVSHLYTETS